MTDRQRRRLALRRIMRGLARGLERGDAESFEFTVSMVPITVMILLIAFATLVRAAQMPAWMAATECARAATSTQNEALGREQAERAARDALSGNPVRASSSLILITGEWAPNAPVTCRVSYNIDVSAIPGFAELTGGNVPVVTEVTLRIEPYKSRWE